MSSFTDPLHVRQLGGRRWATARAFTFYAQCEPGTQALAFRCRAIYEVPAGFETDFASIPRLLWPLIGHPAGEYAQAAVLHDWLYSQPARYPRALADAAFLDAMAVLGVAPWKRRLMWLAVRTFGWAARREAPDA